MAQQQILQQIPADEGVVHTPFESCSRYVDTRAVFTKVVVERKQQIICVYCISFLSLV